MPRLLLFALFTACFCASPIFAQGDSEQIPSSLLNLIRATKNAHLHAYFSSSEIGDVAVVSISGEGNACPAMFRVAYPGPSGEYLLTKEFGDCSDIPTVIFEEKQITVKFPGYAPLHAQSEPNFKPPPPTMYLFSNGRLREIRAAKQKRK